MAKLNRRSRPRPGSKGFAPGALIRLVQGGVFRAAAVPLVGDWRSAPTSYQLSAGTVGLLNGPAPGAPDLFVVVVELENGGTASVELRLEDFTLAA